MIYRIYRWMNSALELGFYAETTGPLSKSELEMLRQLAQGTGKPDDTGFEPHLKAGEIVEIGPRLSIETPFSSNAVSICHAIGLRQVTRVECTRLYKAAYGQHGDVLAKHIDRMTEQHLPGGIRSFDTGILPEPVKTITLIELGRTELVKQNKRNGWGMDENDIDYVYDLFVNILKRNPTDVELLFLGNANSEHCRHFFWKGQQEIDGIAMPQTLMDLVQKPLKLSKEKSLLLLHPDLGNGPNVSLVAFKDNAGVIMGFSTEILLPLNPGKPSEMILCRKIIHITQTAETHNHPTFVAPFPGAETGAGGRIRDNAAVGRGGWTGVGAAGYFVGNLFIPGYEIPGEVVGKDKPSKYASPLRILIDGSNGIASYGNKFGEPTTLGFTRTFGQMVDGEWREPRKPILYSAGGGHIFDEHVEKEKPEVGMLIVRVGGPAYPIGVGGGAASSMTQGQNSEANDFNSVQRGNPEEENKVNRVIRTCAELCENNPIAVIHDQGAGGISNAFTEAIEPLGGKIDIRKVRLGDKTMSVMKIWSAEFQESYAFLIRPEKFDIFKSICERENANCEVLGEIDGNRKVVVEDPLNGQKPVDLDLEQVLGKVPQKAFKSIRKPKKLKPLDLTGVTVGEAIEKVFKLPSVGSKDYLVHKKDRSVTGLVAQQQCCGIAQIPIADCSVDAQSHFGITGAVRTLGENPIRMLIDEAAGARMIVGEALTNMASVLITNIGDIRCRANWMWPAKLPHEGARLYAAVKAMSDFMVELGTNGLEIAPDGGKDSLSMAADVQGETVKAPGALVIFANAPVPDITKKVTPDIKIPGASLLGFIDLGLGKNRLGGSALAQALNQLGDESPDVDDPKHLKNAFLAVQKMINKGLILALHDRSDGGLITAVVEMCMASRCGFEIGIGNQNSALAELFSEELGWVLEFRPTDWQRMWDICNGLGVKLQSLGSTDSEQQCVITAPDGRVWDGNVIEIRKWWNSTSYEIERLQINPDCALEEYRGLLAALPGIDSAPSYNLSFIPTITSPEILKAPDKPKVAILREEGTNGEREMRSACEAAGLAAWDVAMSDLLLGKVSLDQFQGIIFAGGFSYMDVFDSAIGWSGKILFNEKLKEMFDRFCAREDTISLGVCNGCQEMALLGRVPGKVIGVEKQVRFVHNTSGRFESRWVQVEVLPSSSILLSGMEGSKLGIWVAHGEGRLAYPGQLTEELLGNKLVPLAYVDPHGHMTERYPHNPNGSPYGIAGLCSPDGRHLAMMPHPERCFRLWQWPWMPADWHGLQASPWLQMFQNARTWCMEHRA